MPTHKADNEQDEFEGKAADQNKLRHIPTGRHHHTARPSSPSIATRGAGSRAKQLPHTVANRTAGASPSSTSASQPPALFSGVLSNTFKRARTASPPISVEDSEDEVEAYTVRSSRSNSISSNTADASLQRHHQNGVVAHTGSSPPHYPNSSNVNTPLRFSFGLSDPVTMSNGKAPGSVDDGLLTDAMLSLKHSGGTSTTSSSPGAATTLPSYSQAMGQSVEVHTPMSGDADDHTSVQPALLPKPSASEQFSTIVELQKQPLQLGASWYVIDRPWFRLWSTVNGSLGDSDTAEALGTIDTTSLVDPSFPLAALKTGLEEGVDFEVVPQEAWDLLVRWYGRRGRAIERKVILMPGSDTLRLELFPPKLHVYYAAAQAIAPATVMLSITEPLSSLKAAVYWYVEHHQKPGQGSEQWEWRFWRLPVEAAKAVSLSAKDIAAIGGKEAIATDVDTTTLAELQIDQPVEQIVVEARKGGQAWPLGEEGRGAPSTLKGVFRQNGNDFLSRLQRGEKSDTSSAAASTSSPSLDAAEPSVGRITRSQTVAERGADKQQGLTGLYNLGNTCFMNAALQCMSNTKELKDYFVSGVYKSEVNASNPLGMGGAMAKVFGELLSKLWSNGGGAWHPREFKTVLSRFSPQFIGYAQQDTQELLAFLLDGLHEDLNRIVKKPYIEAPDWEGGGVKEMVTFARKQWEIYKMRNDSVIVDLFQGQYRSTLVCPDCEKVSIKFDPFMYLTLPIPNRKSTVRKVTFVPLKGSPVQAEMRLTQEMSIAHLKRTLTGYFDLHIDTKNLVACDVFSHTFYRIYSDFESISEISNTDVTWVYEVPLPLTPIAPKSTVRYYSSSSPDALLGLEDTTAPPDKAEEMAIVPLFTVVCEPHASFGSKRKGNFGQPLFISVPASKVNDVVAVQDAVMEVYVKNASDADALQTYLTRLRDGAAASNTAEDWDMLDDGKIVVPAAEQSADGGEETIAEISDDGNTVRIVPDSRTASQEAQAGPSTAASATRAFSLYFHLHREDQAPVTLKAENYDTAGEELTARAQRLVSLQADAKASWPLIYTGGALVCAWTREAQETFFGDNEDKWSTDVQQFIDPELEAERRPDAQRNKRTLTIDDCLNEFTREEQLGESDPWFCPRCKDFKQATKKFDLWKVPDILVVHLKRFSSGRISRDKIDSLIDFPVNGLDLTDRVEGAKAVQELIHATGDDDSEQEDKMMESISSLDANDDAVEMDAPVYDLYAVDNHFGGLGGGHYTAFAKNPELDKWYNFDDSSVRPVRDVEEVKSAAAYLLFYRRRTTRPIGGKSREKVRQRVKDEEAAARQTAETSGGAGRSGLRSHFEAEADEQQENGAESPDEEMDQDMVGAYPGRARLDLTNVPSGAYWGDEDEAEVVGPALEGHEEDHGGWTRILGSSYQRHRSDSTSSGAAARSDYDVDDTNSIRVSQSSEDGDGARDSSSSSFVQLVGDHSESNAGEVAATRAGVQAVPALATNVRARAIDIHRNNSATVAPL